MITKVAISSQNKKTISGHAGKCRHFYIYSIDEKGNYEKESLPLEKENTLHEGLHGTSGEHPLFDMNILLTLQLGQAAVQRLEEKSLAVYMVQEEDPDTAIKKLIEGTLKAYVTPDHHEGHAGCNCGGGHDHH